MKILIIEPTGKDYDPNKNPISKFEMLIKTELLKLKSLMDTETEFITRDVTDLEDMLYEQSSCHLKKESALYFDTLDMIFINGDPRIAPWGRRVEQLLILLRMCIKTNKPVFATGLGFFCLVMLCATDIEKGSFNIVNGHGYGSKLDEIGKEIKLKKVIEEHDIFLDNMTGDFYRYNYETREWVPKGNMGMHKRIFSEDSGSLGKFIVNSTTYKAKVHDDDKLFVTHKDEGVIYLRKTYIHHWTVDGCPNKFLVMNDSPFEVHPFNFRNPNKTFEIVAETTSGPQVIVFSGESILATQFLLNKNYPATLIPLQNFIRMKMSQIRSGVPTLSISVVDSTWYGREVKESRKIEPESDLRHCGMTASVKGYQYVENNAILKQPHKAKVYDRNRRQQSSNPANKRFDYLDKKDHNRQYKQMLNSSENFVRPKKVDKGPEEYCEKSQKTLLREQMPEFTFKHPGIMKKKFYGNIRLLRSEGFDFDDGWAPGYKTVAKKIDPAIDETTEPAVINETNKQLKDLTEKTKAMEVTFKQQLAAATKAPLPPVKIKDGGESPDRGDKNQGFTIRSNIPPDSPVQSQPVTEIFKKDVKETSNKQDPNEFTRRDVIIRKVAPEFYTRYNFFKKRDKELTSGKFFFSQPYVAPVTNFR